MMPELPEVETTRRALEQPLRGRTVRALQLHTAQLREKLDGAALQKIVGQRLQSLERRGKHLILKAEHPELALHIHLGMSGSLRLGMAGEALRRHEQWQLELDDGRSLRYHDPRKFGHLALMNPQRPPLSLQNLGMEPLDDAFDGAHLYGLSRRKKSALKIFIMNQKYLVGVGNIYAAEALFLSGLHPLRPAASLSLGEAEALATAIKKVLRAALEQGGTTLKDFVSPDGHRGYFVQKLQVYGRGGQACLRCGATLQQRIIGGRSSVFCGQCQH